MTARPPLGERLGGVVYDLPLIDNYHHETGELFPCALVAPVDELLTILYACAGKAAPFNGRTP